MNDTPRLEPERVQTVVIIGGGLIGASWAAYFIARGMHVTIHDPDPHTPARVDAALRAVWPILKRANLVTITGDHEPIVYASLADACGIAQFMLECGPENIHLKRSLIAQMDAAASAEVVLASCSSALLPSAYQSAAQHPERILAAHPFNPPALIPLVEVLAGALTSPAVVDWTIRFFRHVGKHPIRVCKEIPGYIANRMASALYREAVDLVARGVASVADVDAAIQFGPGLRWATMGPHLLYHLGGGEGGYRHYLDHLGPSQEERWQSLGTPTLSTEVKSSLITGVMQEIESFGRVDLTQLRDERLAAVLSALRKTLPD